MTSVAPPRTSPDIPTADSDEARPRPFVRVLIALMMAGFAAFWVWALFFASKEAVNRIDDRAWAERAESICESADADLDGLTDRRRIEEPTPELVREHAELIDAATDIVDRMLDDVVAESPTDPKGQAIVPMWEAEYRTYIADRRSYADDLRERGENLAFYETEVEGLPISERLATFAGDNEMPACAPPYDLDR